MIALYRRNYIGVCGGGIYLNNLDDPNYIGICRGGIYVIIFCRRNYIGNYRV